MSDEARATYVAAMGDELGELFYRLTIELTWQFWRWGQYKKLFATKPTRLDLLNRSAPFFFSIIQRTLFDDALLGITRIAGPETTGRKQNLSVRRLPALIPEANTRQDAERHIADAVAKSEFAMDWRNRYIAHRDLDLALRPHVKPLEKASESQIESALDALACALNFLDNCYTGRRTIYRFYAGAQDADQLLYVIRDGLRREEIRQQRLEAGEYRPEDWEDDAPAV